MNNIFNHLQLYMQKYIIMEKQREDPFDDFISQLEQQAFYKKAISHQSKYFQITYHQLQKLAPKQIKQLRLFILSKRQEDQSMRKRMEEEWLQHEKKLFTWLFLCFLEMQNKSAARLNEKDFQFLSDLSTQKSISLVKYFVHTLSKQKRPVWSKQQDLLLEKILAEEKKYTTVGQWSNVSRQLFLRGDHETYKSGKNCRERWFNHVNPQLKKEWNTDEELKLFQFVIKQGKKWSKIIPLLNNTKSQHMIKNKYNSLIKKMQSEQKKKYRQNDLIKMLIQKMSKEKQNNNYQIQIHVTNQEHSKHIMHSVQIKQQPFNLFESQIIKTNEMPMNPGQKQSNEEQFRFLIDQKLIKEDDYYEGNQNNGEFKLFQSIQLNVTSPLPLTPFQFLATPLVEQSFKSSFNNHTAFVNQKDG